MARQPMKAGHWSGRRVRELVDETLLVFGTLCHLCGGPGANSCDHLVPRSKGGDNSLANRRPSHKACNLARGDKDLADWFATHPLPRREPLAPSRQW